MQPDADVNRRVEDLARAAAADRAEFTPPADPPDPDRAMDYLRDGVGPAVSLFVEVRTGGRSVFLDPDTYDDLEGAMNDWLACYAGCYGVDLEGSYQLRTAATLLVDTHDVQAVAETLTGVPE